MAISDKQIFDWFLANPNADDATVAGAMDQFKLTPADIARATGANVADVQSRYNAATTPTVSPPAASTAEASEVYLGDNRWLNTATGQIRTDWSQAAPVKQIVREEDRGGMHYRYYDDGSVDSSVLSTDNFLDFVGDVAPGIALKTALTMAGGPAGSELGLTLGSGLNTALDLGLSNAAQQAIGSGLIRGTLADATGGNFVTGALSGAAASSPNLTLGDTGITLGNLNTANKVLNANDAASVLSALAADKTISGATSGLLDASTTQALNTGLQVNNIVTQLQAGNEGAALTLLGDLAGSSDLKIAGNAIKAIDAIESGNVGALTSAVVNLSNTAGSTTGSSGSTSGSTSGGGSTTVGNFEDTEVTRLKGLGYTNKQIQDYLNNIDNLTSDQDTAVSTVVGGAGNDVTLPTGVQLASLGDGVFRTDVGGTPIFAESKNAGTVTPPFGYTLLSSSEADNKPEGSYYDITANAWFKPSTDVADLTGNTTLNADADLFTSSLGDLDRLDNTDKTTDDFADFLKTIGITNTTQLADSGLSNQDILDMINAADDTVSVTGARGNDSITGVTGLDTITGAGGNDNIDTVTVTGAKGNDTVTGVDTIKGADGNDLVVDDKGTVTIVDKKESCPIGTVLNPETGECDAIQETLTCPPGKVLNDAGTACIDEVIIKDKKDFCPVGTVLNPETGECDPVIDNQKLECPVGYEPNEAGTACIPVVTITDKKCDPGYVYDEDLKMCVPITVDEACPTGFHKDESGKCVPDTKDDLKCPEGYEPNDAGTACIPIIEIVDKKCPPGQVYDEDLKMCVPIKEEECPTGYHRDPATGACVPDEEKCKPGFHKDASGACVPDEVKCETGYHLENGVCVKDTLSCPEGYELNEAGTECIPVIEIKDKKCDPGYVYDEELKQCVPIKTEECKPGFHLENGVCVKDKLVCAEGFELNAAGTECIPVVKVEDCKQGFHRDETGACVPDTVECGPGYHLENGVCVKDTLECPEGYEPNEAGTACIPVIEIKDKKCGPGFVYDEELQKCVAIEDDKCAPGFHRDEVSGLCVPDDDEECKAGYEKVNGTCVPVCKEGYIRNLSTGVCEKVDDKSCPVGQVRNAQGKCVPIVQPPPPPPPPIQCPTGFKLVNGACVPITTTTTPTYTSSGYYGPGEKNEPIYAGGMDEFNLLATLEELLKESSTKKDTKETKQKTKMASGGHLDDLLAEQMTVDDLLKLLR